MAEIATRYPCPVCLGATLNKVTVGAAPGVEIDHCRRCGGVWLDYGEVQRLRSQPASALWSEIARRRASAVTPCHSCHAPLDRNLEACPACGWKNVIDCPVCDKPMQRESQGGVSLDVCRGCKGVWFDHPELDSIWNLQAAQALQRRGAPGTVVDNAGGVLMDVMWYAPEVGVYGAIGAAHAVSGLAQAATHLPGAVSAAPEVAVHMVEAAGEAAGGVFDVIASILEGLFSLFDG